MAEKLGFDKPFGIPIDEPIPTCKDVRDLEAEIKRVFARIASTAPSRTYLNREIVRREVVELPEPVEQEQVG